MTPQAAAEALFRKSKTMLCMAKTLLRMAKKLHGI